MTIRLKHVGNYSNIKLELQKRYGIVLTLEILRMW